MFLELSRNLGARILKSLSGEDKVLGVFETFILLVLIRLFTDRKKVNSLKNQFVERLMHYTRKSQFH